MRNSVRAPNLAFKLDVSGATTAVRVAVRRARETLLVDVLRGFLAVGIVEPSLSIHRRNGTRSRKIRFPSWVFDEADSGDIETYSAWLKKCPCTKFRTN